MRHVLRKKESGSLPPSFAGTGKGSDPISQWKEYPEPPESGHGHFSDGPRNRSEARKLTDDEAADALEWDDYEEVEEEDEEPDAKDEDARE